MPAPRKGKSEASGEKPKSKAAAADTGTGSSKSSAAKQPGGKSAGKAAKASSKSSGAKSESSRPALPEGTLLDTSHLASSAAALLLARRKGRDQIHDTVSVEQIKADLSKPAAAVAGSVLDQHAEGAGIRRPNLPTSSGPTSHGQTVGKSVERTSVPRRTSG
jgi:hypothetical protein